LLELELLLELAELELEVDELLELGLSSVSGPPQAASSKQAASTGNKVLITAAPRFWILIFGCVGGIP